jgi:hypothetical protein
VHIFRHLFVCFQTSVYTLAEFHKNRNNSTACIWRVVGVNCGFDTSNSSNTVLLFLNLSYVWITNTNIGYKRPHCNTNTSLPCTRYIIAIQDTSIAIQDTSLQYKTPLCNTIHFIAIQYTSLQINKYGNMNNFDLQITWCFKVTVSTIFHNF